MVYNSLEEAEVDHDQVNFYGMIIDASYPYKTPNKFICTLKVVDASMNSIGSDVNKNFKFATVIVYAKRLEDCPIVRKIGDCIRCHRASVKEYKGQKQFHVNCQFNSSWCLFTTSQEHAYQEGQDA